MPTIFCTFAACSHTSYISGFSMNHFHFVALLQPNAKLCLGQLSGGDKPYYQDTCQTKPWLALWCGHHAFASLHSVGPVPAFYKCPIWQELCPAVSLKVLVQIPPSNVNLIQILNDPNDAFQIVSSHITFRENRGLCFINSTGNRWRKTGKSYARPRFSLRSHIMVDFCFANLAVPLTLCA